MQPNTIDAAVDKLIALGDIFDEDRAKIVAPAIIEHSIRNWQLAPIYVEFSEEIVKRDVVGRQKQLSNLRKYLIINCDKIFEEEVKPLVDFKDSEDRDRCLGIVRLLAIMFLYGMINDAICNFIVKTLFDYKKNCLLECYYEFVAIATIQFRVGTTYNYIRESDTISQQLVTLKDILKDPDLEIRRTTERRLRDLLNRNAKHHLILGKFDHYAYTVLLKSTSMTNPEIAQSMKKKYASKWTSWKSPVKKNNVRKSPY